MSALPKFSMRELLEAGVHYGHRTMRWNPRMEPYLYGARNDIHIIDLQKTVPMLNRALKMVHDVVVKNGRVLFVGTKTQASSIVAENAKRCGQYYVNHRWLGGMLTNWNTVSASIRTLRGIEERLDNPEVAARLTKKEILELNRSREKLERSLGGIREMGGRPDVLFVVDTNKEKLAIQEAKKLNIPVIAIVDSNSNPDEVTYPIPGNDDATRAIDLYCKLFSDAALAGIQDSLASSGVDIGAAANLPGEKVAPAAPAKAASTKAEPEAKPVSDAELKSAIKDAEKLLGAEEPKEEPAKKPAAKKPAAKKTADKKDTAEEAKEEPAKKPAAKKPAAKKATTAKKPAAKKATAKKVAE